MKLPLINSTPSKKVNDRIPNITYLGKESSNLNSRNISSGGMSLVDSLDRSESCQPTSYRITSCSHMLNLEQVKENENAFNF